MDEIGFGTTEILVAGGSSVVTEVNMIAPESFKKPVLRPGVVCRSNTLAGEVSAIAPRPKHIGTRGSRNTDHSWSEKSRQWHQPLSVLEDDRVSRSTVRAAS